MIRVYMVGGAVEDVDAQEFFVKDGTLFFNRVDVEQEISYAGMRAVDKRRPPHIAFAPGTWLKVEK